MAYSVDLRKKVIEYLGAGNTQREAAKTFKLSLNTVNKWHQMYQKKGSLEDEKRNRKFFKIDPEKLKKHVEENPEAYLEEIAKEFSCTPQAIYFALKRL